MQPGNESLREMTKQVSVGIEANRRFISTVQSDTKLEEEFREARIKRFTEMVDRAIPWKEPSTKSALQAPVSSVMSAFLPHSTLENRQWASRGLETGL